MSRSDPKLLSPKLLLFFAICLFITISAEADVEIGTVRTVIGTGTTATQFDITNVGISGSNRYLLVGVWFNDDSYETVSSVVLDPGGGNQTSLTHLDSVYADIQDDGRAALFGVVSPPTGTFTVRITISDPLNAAGHGFIAGAWPLTGVDQTTPVGTTATNSATSGNANVTVTSEAGDIVFGIAGIEDQAVMEGSDTEDWDITVGTTDSSVGEHKDGSASSTTLNWTNTSDKWSAIGVAVKPSLFYEVASYAGVDNSGTAYGICWEDYNNDGYWDLWIGGDGQLYTNDGDGTFTSSAECGTGIRGGNWADINNDGYGDLLCSQSNTFYQNDGDGTFTERAVVANLQGTNLGTSAAIDYDNDGYIDFFFPNGTVPPGNEIRENDGDTTFTTIDGSTIDLDDNEANGETCAVGDVNNDGYVDILYNVGSTATFYYNDGNGTFSEDASGAGISRSETDAYHGDAFADYNNDGWLDLYLGEGSGFESRIYQNDGDGTFTRQSSAAPDADLGESRGVDWGDYDNDGDLDLLIGNDGGNNLLYRNDGGGTFTEVGLTAGVRAPSSVTHSVSFADYDNDGDLDIYYANDSAANQLFCNGTDDTNYLKVLVEGSGSGFSSRDGIGTRIELWDNGLTTLRAIREVSGGEGYGNFPTRLQHFGIASAWGGPTANYAVKVKFQSGTEVIRKNIIPANESITIDSTTLDQTIKVSEIRNVYFSVGQNTSDHKTGSPTVTISAGIAEFSVSQTDTSLGIGDEVTYGAGSKMYLSEKVSSTQWRVVTNQGAYPSDTAGAQSVTSVTHCFSSLSAAESGIPGGSYLGSADLVTKNVVLHIPCYYDSGQDSTGITLNGYTTDSDHYIYIYTPYLSTQSNQSQRHDGKWKTDAYNMTETNSECIDIQDNHVRIDGIQFELNHTDASTRRAILIDNGSIAADNDIRISHCIFRQTGSGSGPEHGLTIQDDDTIVRVWNNIFYDFDATVDSQGIRFEDDGEPYVFNNTIYNCGDGINSTGTSYILAKNNVSFGNSDTDYSGNDYDTTNSTNNASNDGSAPGISTISLTTDTWADYFVSASDLHISEAAANSDELTDSGADLSSDLSIAFSTDIDMETRETAMWDVGADESLGTPADLDQIHYRWRNDDGPESSWQITGTANTTTVSASDELVSGMTITPGEGDYLVWFSGSVECSSTSYQYVSLYLDGTQIGHTERQIYTEGSIPNTSFPVACHARLIGVNDGEAIEVKWRTTAGTATMHERTLVVTPVVAADSSQASATANTTTGSASDVLLTGMTLTPGAGDYLIWFSGSVQCNTTNTWQYASIYVNSVQEAHSEREVYTEGSIANTSFPIACHARVTSVGAGEAIEVRWRSNYLAD